MSRIVVSVICIVIFLSGCKNESPEEFQDFYRQYTSTKAGKYNTKLQRQFIVESDEFTIDTILRSMKGSISEKEITLADSGELVWITGYELEVLDSQQNQLSPEFMCHNNLNLTSDLKIPWQSYNWQRNNRVFTLTQGISKTKLPIGFGIPMPGDQSFKVIFQSLNHNYQHIDTTLKHRIIITYYLDSEIDFEIKPLFHTSVWVMKQFEGPPGKYGSKVPKNYEPEIETFNYSQAQQPSCGVELMANDQDGTFDIFWDGMGRRYTGHWKIPPGEEYLEYDVTFLMNLNRDRMVHYISAHVHPFCQWLELYDNTAKRTVYRSVMKSREAGIGMEEISHFSSEEGIQVYKDHKYLLKSKYNNTSSDTLSAMSAMYLFMAY